METSRSAAAFQTLWEAHQGGFTVPSIPQAVRPRTRAEGYAVQAHFAEHTSAVLGWKIAATSEVGQRHINVSAPLAGRVLAEAMVEPGEPISLAGNFMHLAELEFAFAMVTDFPPRERAYSQQEVLAGTGELLLAWEIPSTRFDQVETAGEAQLIADNACGFHLAVLPAAVPDWKDVDLAAQRVRATSTSGAELEGTGARVLGDPRTALTWLVNELSDIGETLQAGQFVTTGICTNPLPVAAGDTITADYGQFGTHTVTFC